MSAYQARVLAAFRRIRRESDYLAFHEEWMRHAPRGTEAALAEALLMDGIGFICSSCGDAYAGNPTRIESRATPEHAAILRVLCRTCHTESPVAEEKRPWPFGRKK